MFFAKQVCAATLLITFTIWLQCGGIATLITWVGGAVASDTRKLGPLPAAALVVRVATAAVVLHLLEILVWAAFYRWLCLPSWGSAFYFSAGSYSTVGCSDVNLPSNWRALGPLESIIGVLMCGISVSLLFAIVQWLIHRGSRISSQ
jgi:voltage-gated potassium channel